MCDMRLAYMLLYTATVCTAVNDLVSCPWLIQEDMLPRFNLRRELSVYITTTCPQSNAQVT